jgi:hypothetical protein
MNESIEKTKKRLAEQALKGTVCAASNGAVIGRIKGAMPSEKGILICLDLKAFVAQGGSDPVGGVSIELPLCPFLEPGQDRVCPARDGWYDVTFHDGTKMEAFFRHSRMQWTIGERIVGATSEITLDGWLTPKIVVGIERLGDTEPTMAAPVE